MRSTSCVAVVLVYAKGVGEVWGEDCINLFSYEHHIQEGEAMPHGKQAWIKHSPQKSFYPVPENSSGCVGGLTLIGEGLRWSHQRQRDDSVSPADWS